MSDFTKLELTMMADGIVLIKCQCKMSDETRIKLDELDSKLCSMINNYCEHKNIETGAYSRSHPPKKCDACGVLYYE